MSQVITARLARNDAQPWGFRLQGGKDFGTPLVIQKVNTGSIADKAGLQAGDAVVRINSTDLYTLRHKEAQDAIVQAGPSFELVVQRGGATWKPAVTPIASAAASPIPGNFTPVTKTSLAANKQQVSNFGSGHNSAARPFIPPSPVRSITNKQYNTPVAMYSDETIAETLSSQAEVLAGGVLGVNFKKNEKVYNPEKSEVLKALQENDSEPEPAELLSAAPLSPHQQSYQQPPQQQIQPQTQVVTKHVHAPIDRPISNNNGGLPAGQNICADCERLIVGVFVRIKDKNLHVECFKCATCGTSLKNQGYFNLHNKLYCDVHARLAALNSPPPNTNGLVPVTTPPKNNVGASTISSALNAHAGNLNGNAPSNFSAPKPFSYTQTAPTSFAAPPQAAPKSPSSYPPPAQPAWAPPSAVNAPVAPKPTGPVQASFNKKPSGFNPKATNKDSFKATDLLKESVERLNISTQNSNFRENASNVIEAMLAARVNKQPKIQPTAKRIENPEFLPPPPIIPPFVNDEGNDCNSCDQDLPLPPPPSPLKIPASILTPPLSSDENDFPLKSIVHIHNNNNVNNNIEKVNYRNKKQHSNGHNNQSSDSYIAPSTFSINKPELSTHARDRRSYIEKNNNEISMNEALEDELDVSKIANGLANGEHPVCDKCKCKITRGPFITALGKTWCPAHFLCVNPSCKRELVDIGFVEEKGDLYCEYCFEQFLAPPCSKCNGKIKGDCLNAIGKKFHPECFKCTYCGKLFGNSPFFLEEGEAYCEADWNELFTTKCFACGFPVEAGDRWVEALNNNYHSQCFNCTYCKKNLEGQSFFAKGGRPFCKAHAR